MSIIRPKVGIGVLLFNENNQLLLGQRISNHGIGTYGPPGGHLEFGESFEECAIRELAEEAGIKAQSAEFFAVTNDIFIEELIARFVFRFSRSFCCTKNSLLLDFVF